MTSENASIEGVLVQPLRQITDLRGSVLHMLRCDSSYYKGFGEVYFSETNPGVIKAWKRHQQMTQNFAVPVGKLLLVLFDRRKESSTCGQSMKIILGRPDNYQLLQIPSMVWYGFQCIGTRPALLVNCTDMPHDPAESETLPIDTPNMPSLWRSV